MNFAEFRNCFDYIKIWIYIVLLLQPGAPWISLIQAEVRGIHPILLTGLNGNPGMKLRLTQKALEYVNSLASGILENEIPNLQLPDISRELPEGKGSIVISGTSITTFKPADSYAIRLIPPDRIIWAMTNMNIGLKGRANGRYTFVLPLDIQGDLSLEAKGINFELNNVFNRSATGEPQIQSISCIASVQHMDMRIDNGGLAGLAINLFKNAAIAQMKPLLEGELCRTVRQFIDSDTNNKLKTLPTRIPLGSDKYDFFNPERLATDDDSLWVSNNNELQRDSIIPMEETHRLAKKIQEHLWLDYSLTDKPRVTSSHIETVNKGEVSWEAQGQTPFAPPKMSEPLFVPDRMFYILISDYLPNSLMYHAYKQGMLRFVATPDNPSFAPYLKTSCVDGMFEICLGDIMPQLGEAFPNQKIELLYHPSRAPAIMFTNYGTVELNAEGVLFIFVRTFRPGSKLQVLSAEVYLEANTTVDVRDGRMVGKMKFHKFNVSLRRTTLPDLDYKTVEELGAFAGSILEGIANDFLQEGLPIPVIEGARLVNPKLTVMNRLIRIETDIEVDQAVLANITKSALENGFSHMTYA